LFFNCDFDPQNINPDKIIGEKGSKIPYGSRGLYCGKYIDGNSYDVHGALYRNKVIAYVIDKGIIVDYFFSNLIEYAKVKNMPLGISYNELVNILGEPVGLIYGSEYIEGIEKGSIADTFGATYFQKTRKPYSIFYGISNYVVVFGFTYDGKLKSIRELHQME
jgi:hypothetical protein